MNAVGVLITRAAMPAALDRREQRVLTLQIRVDRFPCRPRRGRDIGEIGQGPGWTHVVIVEVDDLQWSSALRRGFGCRRDGARRCHARAERADKFTS